MQTASTALAAAIDATQRTPSHSVKVDWDRDGTFTGDYDDLTALVESVTVEQSLTTDLPEAAKLVTGYASSQADVTLAGGFGTDSAARTFSPYNTGSPLAGKTRMGAYVDIDLGFGGEVLDAFRGRVRNITTNARTKTATLSCLDERERFAQRVGLPVIVADDLSAAGPLSKKPGLTSQWVVDYICRQNGFYATPPPRLSRLFSATMLGSAWPETGTLVKAVNGSGGAARVTTGAWQPDIGDPALEYDTVTWAETNNGSNLFFEGTVRLEQYAGRVFWLGTAGSTDRYIALEILNSGGASDPVLRVVVKRSSTVTHILDGPTFPLAGLGPTYLGLHVSMTSTTVTARIRVGGTTTTLSTASSSVTGQPVMQRVALGPTAATDATSLRLSGAQITVEAYSASMWNDTFSPSAYIDASLNKLIGIPGVEAADAWGLIQENAAAEFALALIDEFGFFHYRNRNWRSRTASATVQRTLTTTASLLELGSKESIDSVRNKVIVRAQPVALSLHSPIWSAPEVYLVPQSGSLTIWAKFDGAAFNVDESITYSPLGGQQGSGYRANTMADGTGTETTNLTFTVDTFVSSAKVVITNPNAFDVWIVQPTSSPYAGRPAMSLWGQVLRSVAAEMDSEVDTSPDLSVEVSDAASIVTYSEQLLDLPANRWRQNVQDLAALAADLLSYLKDPKPVLTNVQIVADPRLQLCDRVTVVDPDGLVISHDFHLTGITTTSSPTGGMTQAISARAV